MGLPSLTLVWKLLFENDMAIYSNELKFKIYSLTTHVPCSVKLSFMVFYSNIALPTKLLSIYSRKSFASTSGWALSRWTWQFCLRSSIWHSWHLIFVDLRFDVILKTEKLKKLILWGWIRVLFCSSLKCKDMYRNISILSNNQKWNHHSSCINLKALLNTATYFCTVCGWDKKHQYIYVLQSELWSLIHAHYEETDLCHSQWLLRSKVIVIYPVLKMYFERLQTQWHMGQLH